jgi:hypothetical protein
VLPLSEAGRSLPEIILKFQCQGRIFEKNRSSPASEAA